MPEKFIDYPFITILWVSSLAAMGGVSSYIRKVRDKTIKRFSIVELIGEIFISGFVGIVTFLLCDSAGFDPRITAAIVGVAGHMGSRAIFIIEHMINKKFNQVFDDMEIK